MSYILYYSNYCKHSQKIIKSLSKKNLDGKVHFISIDNREALDNKIYIILEQGKKLLLPKGSAKKMAKIVYKKINKNYKKTYYPSWWILISIIIKILPFSWIRYINKFL